MTTATRPSAPSLETIVRLVEQSLDEQRETRDRLDAYIQISDERFKALESSVDSMRSKTSAQFLMLSNQFADTLKQVERIEEHVGFLTTKVTEHDKRFDAIDKRLDGIDQRLDGIDTRLDAHDKRFDRIDGVLQTIATGVAELQRASAAPKG